MNWDKFAQDANDDMVWKKGEEDESPDWEHEWDVKYGCRHKNHKDNCRFCNMKDFIRIVVSKKR